MCEKINEPPNLRRTLVGWWECTAAHVRRPTNTQTHTRAQRYKTKKLSIKATRRQTQ